LKPRRLTKRGLRALKRGSERETLGRSNETASERKGSHLKRGSAKLAGQDSRTLKKRNPEREKEKMEDGGSKGMMWKLIFQKTPGRGTKRR